MDISMAEATSTAPIPDWLVDERYIVEAATRHSWMCKQLKDRRRIQGSGTSYWYGTILAELFDIRPKPSTLQPEKVFEVLSDGLGYIHPNWHALELSNDQLDVITREFQQDLNGRISDRRNRLSEGTRTQRAVGNLLYESALFAISNEDIWLLSTDPPVEQWVSLSGGDQGPLPLKLSETGSSAHYIDPAASLLAIAKRVLWPSFLLDAPPCECLSLVLLHTSLWHEGAGVWAFHARFRGATTISPRPLTVLSKLRSLVAPAVCCLEDVTGWAYQREGLHRQRRLNVNFLYHSLGTPTPPPWDPDGLGSAPPDRERDAAVYNLPADAPPSVTTRLILRRAKGEQSCSCDTWTCVEIGFTAARLTWLKRLQSEPVPEEPAPTTIELYAADLLRRLTVSCPPSHKRDVTSLLDEGVQALINVPCLCKTCKEFAGNLNEYWTLVKGNAAQG